MDSIEKIQKSSSTIEDIPGKIGSLYLIGACIRPTGGITEGNMKYFMTAGVYSMGIGSALYKPEKSVADIA